jgi:hypothetical protein
MGMLPGHSLSSIISNAWEFNALADTEQQAQLGVIAALRSSS